MVSAVAACGPNTDLTVPPPPQPEVNPHFDVPPPLPTGRLVDWLSPVSYALSLDVDPSADRFTGKVSIELAIDKPTSAFVLHASELDILSAHVVVDDVRIAADPSTRKSAGSNGPEEELVLLTKQRIEASAARLEIVFAGALKQRLAGIYRVKDAGKTYVFTQFEPSDARKMFPCFDDPIYKVPFDATVTVPNGNTAFFNTPEKSRTDVGGKTQFVFETSKRMPTYLVALAIGPLAVVKAEGGPVPIRVITRPGSEKLAAPALRIAKEHLAILSDYFGSPYPYAKLDLVAVPNFGAGAMENAGLVSFREELLLYDEATASAKVKRDVAMTIAHELAHHWFGNLVTMKWWDDLWLNEGFATYMESAVVDRWRPEMRANLELLSLSGWVMGVDALSSARAVRNPVENTYQAMEAFDGITYVKGAAFVRMLQAWLGDEAFKAGLNAYMSQHAWGNASGDDLFAAFARVSGKQVTDVAKTFLDTPGVPLVRAELSCEGAPKVKLEQKRYSGVGQPAEGEWRIPVCVEHGRRRAEPVRDCTVLSSPAAELPLSGDQCPDWVLPNAGYAGYYRFSLPEGQLDALAAQSRTRDALHNIGLLTNLWALVQSGDVPAVKALDILITYKGEGRREVVEEIIAVLEHVERSLVEPSARAGFSGYASALLLPLGKKLGWDGKANDSEDDRLLRRAVLSALSRLTDDPWMAREAKLRAMAFLNDHESVSADTAAIALKHAARRGDVTFEQLEVRLRSAGSPAVRIAAIEALASLGDEAAFRKTLELLMNGTIRAQDGVYVARAAAESAATRKVLVAWLSDHLADVAKIMPGFGLARMLSTVQHICDVASRDEAAKKLGAALKAMGRSGRRLDESLEAASLCIDLRGRQAAATTVYFEKKRRF